MDRHQQLRIYKERMDQLILFLRERRFKPGITVCEKRRIRSQSLTHFLKDGDLYYRRRGGKKPSIKILSSEEEIIDVISKCHCDETGAHSGINTTTAKITDKFYWSGFSADVEKFISTCPVCKPLRIARYQERLLCAEKVLKQVRVAEPLEIIGVDFVGPFEKTERGNQYILICIDYFSKYVELFPLQRKDAATVSKALYTFVKILGAPMKILSDLGKEFCTQVNIELCRNFLLRSPEVTAYKPKAGDLLERTNEVKTHLSKMVMEHGNDWELFLNDVQFYFNAATSPTKFTPYYIMHVCQARLPFLMAKKEDLEEFDIVVDEPDGYVEKKLKKQSEVFEKFKELQAKPYVQKKRQRKIASENVRQKADGVPSNCNSEPQRAELDMVMNMEDKSGVEVMTGDSGYEESLSKAVQCDPLTPNLTLLNDGMNLNLNDFEMSESQGLASNGEAGSVFFHNYAVGSDSLNSALSDEWNQCGEIGDTSCQTDHNYAACLGNGLAPSLEVDHILDSGDVPCVPLSGLDEVDEKNSDATTVKEVLMVNPTDETTFLLKLPLEFRWK